MTTTANQPPEDAMTSTPTMRAVVQRAYGGPETLAVETIDRPSIGPDEVLLRVRAAGIDRGTWHLMTGLPRLVRIAGFGFRAPKNPVPGLDVAGTVVAAGENVTRFSVGDEVFGIARGSLAEYAAAEAAKLAHRPEGLPPERAAVTAVSGLTALQGLRDVGRLEAGQRVLILGASGGVGTFAVQIARSMGGEVTGVASAAKADLVRTLGAARVFDYAREDALDGSERYDLVLDAGGNNPLRRLRRALTPDGTLVIVGGEGGGRWLGGVDRQLRALALSPFVGQRLTTFVSKETGTDMEALAGMVLSGGLTPALDRTWPLAEAADALRALERGEVRGKAAVEVAGPDS